MTRTPSPVGRVAVIGDVGGHIEELRAELFRLGCDPDALEMPSDLQVIQVGDLIHRGSHSEAVVELVDKFLRKYPHNWVQLLGNHEAQYVSDPVFTWHQTISGAAAELVRSWWTFGLMRAAASIRTGDEEFVVTHAGITEGFWRRILHSPRSAELAGVRLNELIGTGDGSLFRTGHMLGVGKVSLRAGPLWASAAFELIPSWANAGAKMPFSQIHGHSSVIDWSTRQLADGFMYSSAMSFDFSAAHETARIGATRLIGIDPGHDTVPHVPWRALVLEGAQVI
ncbi:metallophosphoesterase [Modestobacter sp. I12A-02662]|uniref:metallophosphoesterase n=1 Tax=Modestobacter sp. I12A-02662 TaxID=1730496 RepID=UPI0034DF1268